MRVGLLTLSLRLHAVENIKARRSIVKRILADVQRLGPSFAACEVAGVEDLEALTVRIAHLSADSRFTDSALRRLAERFEHKGEYVVAEARIEML